MNRAELISRMNEVSTELLRENGYISFVDVLLRMGKLAKEDYEAWRLGTIPYLERAIRLNLSQLKDMLRTLKDNARTVIPGRLSVTHPGSPILTVTR